MKLKIVTYLIIFLLSLSISCGKEEGKKSILTEHKTRNPEQKQVSEKSKPLIKNEPIAKKEVKPSTSKIEYSLDWLLDLNENDYDYAVASLVICKEEKIKLPLFKYLSTLDKYAAHILKSIPDNATPRDKIKVLRDFIYNELKIKTSRDRFNASLSLLNNVLIKKEGTCLGLTELWLALGEKLEFPLYPVVTPKHIFVRWDDGKNTFNIETLDIWDPIQKKHIAGQIKSDDEMISMLQIDPKGIKNGAYMKSLSKKEFISVIYSNLAAGKIILATKISSFKKYKAIVLEAKQNLDLAIDLLPVNILALQNLAILYINYINTPAKAEDIIHQLNNYTVDAYNYLIELSLLMKEKKYKKAETLLTDITHSGNVQFDQRITILAAQLYLAQDKYAETLKICNTVLKRETSNAIFYYLKSKALLKMTKFRKALSNAFFTIKYAPDLINGHLIKAMIHFQEKDFKAVENEIKTMRKLNKSRVAQVTIEYYEFLYKYYTKIDNIEKAESAKKSLVELTKPIEK